MKLTIPVLLFATTVYAQCPMHEEHMKQQAHHDGVDSRGDQAMGFEHAKTTHHFILREDGGQIQVTANDPADTTSRDQIRQHLTHIATSFAQGDFELPMFIHAKVPPGVPVMKKQKDLITYRFEEIESGGRVVISTKSSEAVDAIHEFLRFQIEDHRTGDPTSVPPAK